MVSYAETCSSQCHSRNRRNGHCFTSQQTKSRHDRDRHQRANLVERIPDSEGEDAAADRTIVTWCCKYRMFMFLPSSSFSFDCMNPQDDFFHRLDRPPFVSFLPPARCGLRMLHHTHDRQQTDGSESRIPVYPSPISSLQYTFPDRSSGHESNPTSPSFKAPSLSCDSFIPGFLSSAGHVRRRAISGKRNAQL